MPQEIRTVQLHTPFENDTSLNWQEYPRPQMKRNSYIPLSGTWRLALENSDGHREKIGEIIVPYPPESRISGIGRQLGRDEKYIYSRTFEIDEKLDGKKVIMHFGAVDTRCIIYVNDRLIGGHVGGYVPFDIDITSLAKTGTNKVKVEVSDRLDTEYSYGKQSKNRGGMWYTPISGIWQTVWVEILPAVHIESLKITPSLDSVCIETTGGNEEKNIEIFTDNGVVTHSYIGDKTEIKIENPVNWTPENPYLYNFTVTSGEDRIESYFALRTVTIQNVKGQRYICLNGKPYFFHGLLDQGYYSDGIYTPATPMGYLWDIRTAKKLGFNTLRKHVKLEPDLFYYYCDREGMIVFQDMLNSGEYHYIIDTVLPTLGMKRGVTHRPSEKRRAFFEKECRDIISNLYNHPSVCFYTIFNEGWGQYEADRIYTELKEIDPSRVWNASSGWFKENSIDVDSEHIYFKPVKVKPRPQKPMLITEFGGYAYKVDGHSFNLDKTYGYKKFATARQFTQALTNLYTDKIVKAIKNGLNGAIITQLSDVEDETNGMVTYDRRVVKTDEAAMQKIADILFRTFYEKFE